MVKMRRFLFWCWFSCVQNSSGECVNLYSTPELGLVPTIWTATPDSALVLNNSSYSFEAYSNDQSKEYYYLSTTFMVPRQYQDSLEQIKEINASFQMRSSSGINAKIMSSNTHDLTKLRISESLSWKWVNTTLPIDSGHYFNFFLLVILPKGDQWLTINQIVFSFCTEPSFWKENWYWLLIACLILVSLGGLSYYLIQKQKTNRKEQDQELPFI